jgi:hypothetical protein
VDAVPNFMFQPSAASSGNSILPAYLTRTGSNELSFLV